MVKEVARKSSNGNTEEYNVLCRRMDFKYNIKTPFIVVEEINPGLVYIDRELLGGLFIFGYEVGIINEKFARKYLIW